MIPLTMRPATPADKAAVTELALAIDPHDYVPELFDELVAGQYFYVAEQAGRIAGCHAYDWVAPGQMYLYAMRIHPELQGKGIGSAYCQAQIEFARRAGAREIWLNSVVTNFPAHRTVEKNGFVKRGEWIGYEELPLAMLPAGPARLARAGRPEDLPLLAPFRRLPLADVMGSPGDSYGTISTRDEDWALPDLAVVPDGQGGLAGAMLLRDGTWGALYIRRLEGTPEAAADLLAYARGEALRRGKEFWSVSAPVRAEHLLGPAHVDPAKAFRTYAFQFIVSSLTMRLARPADKAAVTALAVAINPDDYVPELFDEFVGENRFWVAEQDGEIAGCHAHSLYFPGQMYLFAMRIRPDMQGRGIGSAYCSAQVELGRQMGVRELWLISEVGNAPAHRTVMKNGFVNRGEWVSQEGLPLDLLPADPGAGPSRARAGRPGDLPLLAPLRSLPLGDVLPAAVDQYHLGSARDEDWALSDLVVVDDGDGGLAGAMLLRETDWGSLYIRRLEGTPAAAAELLAYARAEGARRGKQDWVYSLPARAEHLLAPAHVDPAKSFRTYAFQYIVR